MTVTLNVQLACDPSIAMAVTVTMVTPILNAFGALSSMVTLPSGLLTIVGSGQDTEAVGWPESVLVEISPGQFTAKSGIPEIKQN